MSLGSELRKALDRVKDNLNDADYALAVRMTTRYSELAARRMAGEDVDDDLKVVIAALDNIRAGIYGSLGAEVRAVVMDFVTGVLRALVARV